MPALLIEDLVVDQGIPFEKTWVWRNPDTTPINTAGCTGWLEVRRSSLDPLVLDAEVTFPSPSTDGKVKVAFDATSVAGFPFWGLFQLKVRDSLSQIHDLIEGRFVLRGSITKQP